MRAVLGNEGIVHDDVLAPGSGQTRDAPGVVDRVVAVGQEECPHVAGSVGVRDEAAKEDPGAGVATAREGPAASNAEPAGDGLDASRGRVRGADRRVGVLLPDVSLRLLGEQGQLPWVDAEHREHPTGGGAGGCNLRGGLVKAQRIELETSPRPGLECAHQARPVERGHGVLGDAPQLLRLRRTRPQLWQQLARSL